MDFEQTVTQQPVQQLQQHGNNPQHQYGQDQPLSHENKMFLNNLSHMLNLSDLPNSVSFTM